MTTTTVHAICVQRNKYFKLMHEKFTFFNEFSITASLSALGVSILLISAGSVKSESATDLTSSELLLDGNTRKYPLGLGWGMWYLKPPPGRADCDCGSSSSWHKSTSLYNEFPMYLSDQAWITLQFTKRSIFCLVGFKINPSEYAVYGRTERTVTIFSSNWNVIT